MAASSAACARSSSSALRASASSASRCRRCASAFSSSMAAQVAPCASATLRSHSPASASACRHRSSNHSAGSPRWASMRAPASQECSCARRQSLSAANASSFLNCPASRMSGISQQMSDRSVSEQRARGGFSSAGSGGSRRTLEGGGPSGAITISTCLPLNQLKVLLKSNTSSATSSGCAASSDRVATCSLEPGSKLPGRHREFFASLSTRTLRSAGAAAFALGDCPLEVLGGAADSSAETLMSTVRPSSTTTLHSRPPQVGPTSQGRWCEMRLPAGMVSANRWATFFAIARPRLPRRRAGARSPRAAA
mmetsp:Transcript_92637/g.262055  ORF Transcript_92637/g.262055 Transcript_92637/m.262055 type:complete len:309 (+) Transcript_92637:61-987(+)